MQRKVFKNLSVNFNKTIIVLDDTPLARKAIGNRVTVALPLEGDLEALFDETPLPHRVFDKIRGIGDGPPPVVDRKRLGVALAMSKALTEIEPHHYARNAHVMAGFRTSRSQRIRRVGGCVAPRRKFGESTTGGHASPSADIRSPYLKRGCEPFAKNLKRMMVRQSSIRSSSKLHRAN